MDDIFSSVYSAWKGTENIWYEDPVTVNEYVENTSFLGYPSFTPRQREEIEKFLLGNPKDLFNVEKIQANIACWVWGKGCLAAKTRIKDVKTGEIHSVGEWTRIKKQFHVYALDERTNQIVVAKANVPFLKGTDTLYKVQLNTGKRKYSITVTSAHKFMTAAREWKKLRELKVDDELVFFKTIDKVSYRKIDSITEVGEGKFYDFTVPVYHNYFSHGFLNHNSGKDWVTSILQSYFLYVICCMNNPLKYFLSNEKGQYPVDEKLDLLNVAYNGDQAEEVFFDKLIGKIENCKWFLNNFSVYKGRKQISDGNRGTIKILEQEVTVEMKYPMKARIVCTSENSINESFEGKNVIFWTLDEASAFRSKGKVANANKIFETLTTSGSSRFGNKYRGVVISYPRDSEDFTMNLHNDIKSGKFHGGVTSLDCTWIMNPTMCKSGKFFDFVLPSKETVKVPMELKNDFDNNPEDSMMKYMCIASSSSLRFYQFPDRIDSCINRNRKPLFEYEMTTVSSVDETGMEHQYLAPLITVWNAMDNAIRKTPHVIHIDGALSGDRASLVLAHGVPSTVDLWNEEKNIIMKTEVLKLIIDAIVVVEPTQVLRVSLNSLCTLVFDIASKINVIAVSYDQWNSQSSIESLQRAGKHTICHNVNATDHRNLRSLFYSLNVDMLNHDLAVRELKRLVQINPNRIHHMDQLGESCDISDGMSGVNYLLNSYKNLRHMLNSPPVSVLSGREVGGTSVESRFPATIQSTGSAVMPGPAPGGRPITVIAPKKRNFPGVVKL